MEWFTTNDELPNDGEYVVVENDRGYRDFVSFGYVDNVPMWNVGAGMSLGTPIGTWPYWFRVPERVTRNIP